LKTRAVDVKVAPNLRVGYVMGTGDTVPEAIEGLTGLAPHLLTATELLSADLSAWDVIVIGIRAYSNRPELGRPAAPQRLRRGRRHAHRPVPERTFPAPFPLAMGRTPERVVDESDPVKLLAPENKPASFAQPITPHDFDGWVEERGHSFLDSWDPAYTALTETADQARTRSAAACSSPTPAKGPISTWPTRSTASFPNWSRLLPHPCQPAQRASQPAT
jgi:hypothetical protein